MKKDFITDEYPNQVKSLVKIVRPRREANVSSNFFGFALNLVILRYIRTNEKLWIALLSVYYLSPTEPS